MKNNYDDLNDTFNTEIEVQEVNDSGSIKKHETEIVNDAEKDYKYARAQLYSLIEKGQETLNGVMELAGESASPRAYEVAGQVLKSTADITDKLADLQKKMKDLDEDKPNVPNTVTNNAVFVGSTTELQKMLKRGILNNNNSED
ncbi:MAG: terminase [Flavobacteriales bacterium TMED228]|nr:MAG: terminase [Flavobacteriales bacterium TMED228]